MNILTLSSAANKDMVNIIEDEKTYLTSLPQTTTAFPSAKTPLVELRNGKIVFKQKTLALEKLSETLQEIVRFREMLTCNSETLIDIPSEHLPLVAKLTHESEKTLSALCKSIRQQLLPEPIESDNNVSQCPLINERLPLSAVERAVLNVAERVNYGVDISQLDLNGPSRVPAALCLWRWEVKDRSTMPKQFKDRLESRWSERIAAKKELGLILNALTQDQKASLLGLKLKWIPDNMPSSLPSVDPPQKATKENYTDATQDVQTTSKNTGKEPAKVVKFEKQVKEEESTKKSAAAFAKFFSVAKPPKKPISALPSGSKTGREGPADIQSDFEKTFHPYVVKKNVQMAPQNWFLKRKRDVVVIDIEENTPFCSARTPHELLQSALRSMPPALPPYRQGNIHLGKRSGYSIREIITKLNDAEVRGNEAEVLSLMELLRDRQKFPAKILSFADDIRPSYTGTWTRPFGAVRPRRPFAKDVVAVDYSYDSGEEWEEEGEGEEVASDSESRDDNASDDDSLSGWLVGDDEDVGGDLMDGDPMDVDMMDIPDTTRKRKTSPAATTEAAKTNIEKRRKVIIPLVPFSKGPSWEPEIGNCTWDGFYTCRIQFFNGASYSINPFTYVSEIVEAQIDTAPVHSIKDQFRVPAPIDRLGSDNSKDALPPTEGKRKEAMIPPKTAFPDAYLPVLLQGIRRCKAASFPVLVDTLFQELRHAKVKKKSIEFKIKEVAEKRVDGDYGKIWVVKDDNVNGRISIVQP